MWLADHGANGPEVVVAVGGSTTEEMGPSAVRSRCWSEVFAARCSTQTPCMGCAARDRGYGHQQAWPEPKTPKRA